MSANQLLLLLLSIGCGIPGVLLGQESPSNRSGRLKFQLVAEGEIPRATLDSVVGIKAHSRGVEVRIAFNNPCQIRPKGQFRVQADTIRVIVDHHPHLSPATPCPGMYVPESFSAVICPLRAGHYTVHVAFDKKATGLPSRELLQDVEVE